MPAGFYPPLPIDLSPVLWNVVRRRANLLFMNVVMKKEPSIQDVLDAVSGLSTHMDSEFANVRTEMATGLHSVKSEIDEVKTDLQHVKNDVITEIDRFVVLHQSLDVELVSLRSRQNRQDHFLVKVAKKLDLEYERN